jgi:NADH-quinone oxidoreductase subunit N
MIALIKPILPELVLFFGGCIILLLDVFQVLRQQLSNMTAVLCIICILLILNGGEGVYYSETFTVSLFTKAVKISVLLLVLFQTLSAQSLIDKYALNANEHSVMMIFMVVGIFMMVSSNHLMLLYVGMEIQALSAYTLVVMQRHSSRSAEAGVKYFILGSLASVTFLFGCSYIYGSFGSLYLTYIFSQSFQSVGILGAMLILTAFLFKVGLFPFHQWIPDVYQGAPMPSTSMISTVSKFGAVAVLLKLFVGFSKHIDFEMILSIIAAASMLIGALLPIVQTHIKRFLAYSAIGHAGFMLMGVVHISATGISSIFAYMLVYSLTLMMTFVCLMSLQDKRAGGEDHSFDISLSHLEGLSQIRPKHTFVLAVCLLSMGGMPPLIGFFPKLLILQHILSEKMIVLAVIAIICSVINLFYYLKIVKIMYIDVADRPVIGASGSVNLRLFWVFFPVLLFQLLGCYVPILQKVYLHYVMPSAESMLIGMHETNSSRANS